MPIASGVAKRGMDFVLLVSDEGTTGTFTELAGLRATSFTINNEQVDISTKSFADKWRRLMANAGLRSMSISGAGVFEDDAMIERVRDDAFSGDLRQYRIQDEDGATYTGNFQVSSFELSGEHNDAEQFSITLESAGSIVFVNA